MTEENTLSTNARREKAMNQLNEAVNQVAELAGTTLWLLAKGIAETDKVSLSEELTPENITTVIERAIGKAITRITSAP